MKQKPVILTTSFADEDCDKKDFEYICVRRPYIECLRFTGAIPVVVPRPNAKRLL